MLTTWTHRADTAGRTLIGLGRDFSADDLRDLAGVPDDDHSPNRHNNAIGAWFGQMASAGLIVAVGTTRSTSRERKGGLIRTWRATPAGLRWAETATRDPLDVDEDSVGRSTIWDGRAEADADRGLL